MKFTNANKKRLLELLAQCHAVDQKYEQFGSNKHQYRLNPPLSSTQVRAAEEQYGFKLPEDYFWFLTQVGNGGAGPNYGLYSFGTNEQHEDFLRLAQLRILDPKASPEEYDNFIEYYHGEECEDDEYDRRENELWQGLLTIGTAGCTYDMMLVVTGTERGRILHVDRDLQRPYFSPDASFLDWYERWLVETAEGCQMSGFNSRIGGNSDELCERYLVADEVEKNLILSALHKYRTVAPAIVERIYTYFMSEKNSYRKGAWLSHLSRFGHAQTDYLLRAGLTDPALCEKALSSLYFRFYSREKVGTQVMNIWSPEVDAWYTDILAAFPLAASLSPDYGGAFYSCSKLLTACSQFQMEDVESFFHLENLKQRSWFFYECQHKPMSRKFAELYLAWLQENCETRNYYEINSALGECTTIIKQNELEMTWMTNELIVICMNLLKDFSRVPLASKNSYIRDNVYRTLKLLNKDRAWVDRHR